LTPKIVKAQVIITDERIMTDPDEVRRDAALELGGAVGTKIDTDLVGLFSSFTNNVGAAGSALAISVVAAGVSLLRATPVPGPFSVVLQPHGWFRPYRWLQELFNYQPPCQPIVKTMQKILSLITWELQRWTTRGKGLALQAV
jgi:hypothetical protein